MGQGGAVPPQYAVSYQPAGSGSGFSAPGVGPGATMT